MSALGLWLLKIYFTFKLWYHFANYMLRGRVVLRSVLQANEANTLRRRSISPSLFSCGRLKKSFVLTVLQIILVPSTFIFCLLLAVVNEAEGCLLTTELRYILVKPTQKWPPFTSLRSLPFGKWFLSSRFSTVLPLQDLSRLTVDQSSRHLRDHRSCHSCWAAGQKRSPIV